MVDEMETTSHDPPEISENTKKLLELTSKKVHFGVPPSPQCYCGKSRNYSVPEFQCSFCYRWFHLHCINFDIGPALPFMTAYHFMCKKCNSSNEEVFSKKQANFANMCQTALANLMCNHDGRVYFSEEKELIPYLEQNWDLLTSQPRRLNDSWHTNIHKTLISNELFQVVDVDPQHAVCLSCQDVSTIGPSYERFRALTSQLKTSVSKRNQSAGQLTDSGGGDGSPMTGDGSEGVSSKLRKGTPGVSSGISLPSACTGGATGSLRSTRRSTAASVASGGGSSGFYGIGSHEDSKTRVNEYGIPLDHPRNTENYRYILVEPDPHAQGRQQWDECEHTAGKPIPSYFYRVCLCPKVVLSFHDKAHQLKLQDSQMSVVGDKGYCMVRATHSVHMGTWYFEATITDQPEGSATRIGWSQLISNLQAPCGYDKFSYSWRSRLGTVFHNSRGKHYSDRGYSRGDVIGCLIHLPKVARTDMIPSNTPVRASSSSSSSGTSAKSGSKLNSKGDNEKTKAASETPLLNYIPETYKDRPLVKFRNFYYFEDKEDPLVWEKQLQPLPNSKVVFYRNGKCLGTAYENIFAGAYFPTISVYKAATVRVNFGPDFQYPPSNLESCNPMSDRRESAEIEQTMADMLYLNVNDRLIESLMKECRRA